MTELKEGEKNRLVLERNWIWNEKSLPLRLWLPSAGAAEDLGTPFPAFPVFPVPPLRAEPLFDGSSLKDLVLAAPFLAFPVPLVRANLGLWFFPEGLGAEYPISSIPSAPSAAAQG